MVKLRLKRFGRRNRPFFRLNVMDTRTPRNGESIEELGMYDPLEKDPAKGIHFNAERVNYWLSMGAQPSETVRDLLAKTGVIQKPAFKVRKISSKEIAAKEKAAKLAAAAVQAEAAKAAKVAKAAVAAEAAKAAEKPAEAPPATA